MTNGDTIRRMNNRQLAFLFIGCRKTRSEEEHERGMQKLVDWLGKERRRIDEFRIFTRPEEQGKTCTYADVSIRHIRRRTSVWLRSYAGRMRSVHGEMA